MNTRSPLLYISLTGILLLLAYAVATLVHQPLSLWAIVKVTAIIVFNIGVFIPLVPKRKLAAVRVRE